RRSGRTPGVSRRSGRTPGVSRRSGRTPGVSRRSGRTPGVSRRIDKPMDVIYNRSQTKGIFRQPGRGGIIGLSSLWHGESRGCALADARYCALCGTLMTHSRSKTSWWLFAVALGMVLVAGLVCMCALGICGLRFGGSIWQAADPSPTPTIWIMPPPTAGSSVPPASPVPTQTPSSIVPTAESLPPIGNTAGSTAPDFTLQTVDGQSVTLSDLRGTHVVLIDFWATWCGPCRQELPHVQDLYDTYRDRGLMVLGLDLRESATQVQGFLAVNGYTFPMLLDRDGAVAQQYGVRGIPTSVVIDSQGIIRKVQVGYSAGAESELASVIESLLPR
ncbi:MAG: redoxin domain-containing protein, partial [Chloroflexi bacterium]|nr:redoxin domain-containing protein [Chloroflexota bacterium]